MVDGYLLATIMLIFALGLYELFVSRIDDAEGSEFASRLLLIRSLDDLKDRLAKVVLRWKRRSRPRSTSSTWPWAPSWWPARSN